MIGPRTRPRYFLAVLLALVVSGCETPDFVGGTPERRAEAMALEGRHADAASLYIGLASTAIGTERDRLTLLAAEQWLDAGDGNRARNALRSIDKPSGGDLLWFWNTDVAALYLFLGRPDDALEILGPMTSQPLPQRHRLRAEALRADAYFQKDEPSRAVQLYIQRETWMDSNRERQRNRQRLWAGLNVSNAPTMRSEAETAVDPVVRGWLTIGALAAATGQQGIGWSNGVVRWRDEHPGHPAMAVLNTLEMPQGPQLSYPRQVALLLPLSGRNATAGRAVQNGFFGAYYAALAGLAEPQTITVHDIGDGDVESAYAEAVASGAEFVVGPLIRRNVQAIAEIPTLSVPMLALNNLPDEVIVPPGFYQFALAPEDEAASAAARALGDEHQRGIALYPNNDWGRRVMQSFAGELQGLGGQLLAHSSYQTSVQDFSLEIESLLGLTDSIARANRLKANLGQPLQFEPRRRQDVDFIFLAADARIGRLLKSQLKFHYAGDIPVYATSFIHSMDGRSNRDLNGIMFADAPWVISPPNWLEDFPPMYEEFWPAEKRMGRLHAMGYDAYQLISNLYSGSEVNLQGASGELFLDQRGRVHRRLAWAQFQGGVPVAMPDPLLVESFDEDVQPREWRDQRLNP